MEPIAIIDALENNTAVFEQLFKNVPNLQQQWRPKPDKWNLLEILCHLVDEEVLDFRTRVFHCLNHPETMPPTFDPIVWVQEHQYSSQNYTDKLGEWASERQQSIKRLRALNQPDWSLGFDHAHFGRMNAGLFLANWLAHDYLHYRQITATKFAFLKDTSGISLKYAGDWKD